MPQLINPFARRFPVLCLLAAALIARAAQAAAPAMKIGVMLCLSGDCAEWGSNGLKGVRLAAHELNQRGGILGRRVALAVEDSRDTVPSRSVAAYQKLAQDREVGFIIGPTWTVGGMPIAPLIAKNRRIIVMSPSVGVREFNQSADNIFNDWPHDEVATRAMAAYAIRQGWKRGAIFGSQDPFYMTQTGVFEREFTARGGTIAAKVEPLPDSRELKAEALRIKSADPDFVVFTSYQADVIAKELAAIKFSKPRLAVQMEKNRVKDAGGALEGVVFAMYDQPARGFQERFRAMFGTEPGISADTAYDALMVYAQAVERAGQPDPAAVREALRSTRSFTGASGTFSFDDKGAVDKAPVLWRVKGLNYERVAP